MTTQNILTADVLDIVFENRNKAYGAYILRKYYDKRLANSLGIMLFIVAAICLLSFRFGKKPLDNINNIKGEVVLKTISLIPKEEKKIEDKPGEQKKAMAQKPGRPFETFKNKTIEIVNDNKVKDKDTVVSQILLDTRANGSETKSGEKGGDQLANIKNTSDYSNGDGLTKDEAAIDKNDPLDYADIPPSYPGGIEALQNFLRRNLRTPDELEAGQSASVKIKFVVSCDGEMYGYDVVQSAGNAFDNEVLRVLKKMPKWVPGKLKGQSVSVYYIIPVKFESIEE